MFKKKRNIGKLLLGSFLIVAVLTACMEEKREMKIDMLSRPGTIDRNVSYQGNRLPLKPLHFIKLPVGTIEPEGWLKKYLLLQKEGLTGKLGEISAWLDKKDNAWLLSGGDHGWEEVPYWLKGYGDLAYILKVQNIKPSQVLLELSINHQGKNVAQKYAAWGWRVIEINGNDANQIREALKAAKAEAEKPTPLLHSGRHIRRSARYQKLSSPQPYCRT